MRENFSGLSPIGFALESFDCVIDVPHPFPSVRFYIILRVLSNCGKRAIPDLRLSINSHSRGSFRVRDVELQRINLLVVEQTSIVPKQLVAMIYMGDIKAADLVARRHVTEDTCMVFFYRVLDPR